MSTALNHAEVIEKVASLLEAEYIFLEVAQAMSARLRERLPDYAACDSRAFAAAVMQDLREISKDKHLGFRYEPETAAYLTLHADTVEPPADYIRRMSRDNFGFEKVEWLPGRIGLIDLRRFPHPEIAGEIAVGAMAFLANAKALIFDLRKNGGGQPQMIQLLTSYLFSADPILHLNSFYFRASDTHTHFWTLPYVPGKRLADADVYVLTSNYTFSGGEEFAYNLKTMGRATLIGETTGGGAHPVEGYPITEEFILIVPNGRAINPITKTNWEGVGVEPHIKVPATEALTVARKMALEKLVEKTSDEKEKESLNEALASLAADG